MSKVYDIFDVHGNKITRDDIFNELCKILPTGEVKYNDLSRRIQYELPVCTDYVDDFLTQEQLYNIVVAQRIKIHNTKDKYHNVVNSLINYKFEEQKNVIRFHIFSSLAYNLCISENYIYDLFDCAAECLEIIPIYEAYKEQYVYCTLEIKDPISIHGSSAKMQDQIYTSGLHKILELCGYNVKNFLNVYFDEKYETDCNVFTKPDNINMIQDVKKDYFLNQLYKVLRNNLYNEYFGMTIFVKIPLSYFVDNNIHVGLNHMQHDITLKQGTYLRFHCYRRTSNFFDYRNLPDGKTDIKLLQDITIPSEYAILNFDSYFTDRCECMYAEPIINIPNIDWSQMI